MKITFLGTGTSQGVPVIGCGCAVCRSNDPREKRLRASLMIEINNNTFIIDCGPDFRQQMLRENIKDIRAIILTHEHRDHIAGIDEVRAFNYVNNKAVDIYSNPRVIKAIKVQFPYIYAEKKYPGIPELNFYRLNTNEFEIDGARFLPIQVMHYKLSVLGLKIESFAYITDASFISMEEKRKLIGIKYLVINALRRQRHFSHFSLKEALQLVKELAPKNAYITHISHSMGLINKIESELPANVKLAYDGFRFET